MVSESQKRATMKYERKSYDKILVRVRKDVEPTRDTITAAAGRVGMSLNAYILEAIEEKMQRDGNNLAKAGKDAEKPAAQPLKQQAENNPMEDAHRPILRASLYATD